MKYLYIPVAFCIIVVLLAVYFSAAILGWIFGALYDWMDHIVNTSDRVIMRLKKWAIGYE